MKYNNDRRFNKQVSHLSSFIGMPMWNGTAPTLSEIREYDRRVLEQQALALENKRIGFFQRSLTALSHRISRVFTLVFSAKQKTLKIKHEIAKPVMPDMKCLS